MDPGAIIFVWLLTFVARTSCEDTVIGSLLESSDPQPGSQSMPENVTVNVTVGGEEVQLDLKVDHNASRDIPVYVFSRDENGQLATERVNRKKGKGFAVYRDARHGAVFSARRDVETGQGHLSLEGLLTVGNKIYDLKSSKRRYRSRNSTADVGNGKASFQGHDVKRRDVSGNDTTSGGQNETGDQHEFVVRLLGDLPASALTDDAIPPPNRENKTVKGKNVLNAELQRHLVASAAAASPPVSGQGTGSQDVYIDIVAVADYGVFSSWLSDSSGATADDKTMEVLEKLPQYYAFVFSGVNMLYESINTLAYNIHVKLSGIVIATRPADSPWTESLRRRASPQDEVDSRTALDSFSKWAGTADILPSYDHLTLFTGYDLTKKVQYLWYWEQIDNSIIGIAYVGTLCSTTGLSSSIVEDHGSFERVFTVAHELGHSISASHDGVDNLCYAENQYIMSAIFDPHTATNRHHLWQFSACSVNYFRTFISKTVSTPRGRQCLHNTIMPNKYIPDVSGQQPGQVYDYDDQCRQVYGPSSSMCRGLKPTPADICMKMYCDMLDGFCYPYIAARGTSCGNKKWCVNGDCVFDSRAPAMDETCPFGDGDILGTYRTCAELVAANRSHCYNKDFLDLCCSSCAKYRRPVTHCEYGDRLSTCSKTQCPTGTLSYPQDCCETCDSGTTMTTLAGSTTPRASSASKTSVTVAAPSGNRVYGACDDNLSERIQGKTCADLVAQSLAQCYDSHVIASCCASCRARNTGVTGCEFGDRYPAQCSFAMLTQDSCQTRLREACCQICADRTRKNPNSSAVQWRGVVTSGLIGWAYIGASLLHVLLSD